MARAVFVKSAQKAIYKNGKRVEYVSQKGKRIGQTLSKIDKTIPENENDEVFIAKGESYWWWAFQYGGKHFSKTQPKASQLTQSNYLSQLYDIQERLNEVQVNSPGDVEFCIDEFKDEIENLKDETDSSLQNMPEQLQQVPTGELLQERIDALDNAISELESIDCDYEEPDDEMIKEEIGDSCTDEEIEEKKNEKLQEWLDEKISEIQSISLE